MKMVFSILFLVITSLYVLPVKEVFANAIAVSMVELEEKEENNKKENFKDLFSFSDFYTNISDRYSCEHQPVSFNIPVLLHTVETPPPDLV